MRKPNARPVVAIFGMLIAVALALNTVGCANGQPTAQAAQAVNTAFAVADASLAVYQQAVDDDAAALDAAGARLKADPGNQASKDAWVSRQRALDRATATLTQYRAYLLLAKALAPVLVNPPQVIAPPSTANTK